MFAIQHIKSGKYLVSTFSWGHILDINRKDWNGSKRLLSTSCKVFNSSKRATQVYLELSEERQKEFRVIKIGNK